MILIVFLTVSFLFSFPFFFLCSRALSYPQLSIDIHGQASLRGGIYVAVLVAVLDSLGFGLDSMYIQIIAYTSTTISSVACTHHPSFDGSVFLCPRTCRNSLVQSCSNYAVLCAINPSSPSQDIIVFHCDSMVSLHIELPIVRSWIA